MPSFVPAGDAELLGFAQNYSAVITADPVAVGLTPAIATTLSGYVTAYQTKLSALDTPSNRNPVGFQEKDEAKKTLVSYIRQTARQIQGTMTVTDLQRTELRLPIRDTEPTPVEQLTVAPALTVLGIFGHNIHVRVRDASGAVRGRPVNADAALIYSFVGETAPVTADGWKCEGPISKDSALVAFDPALAVGTKVFLTAQWFNTRGTSPGCTPVAAVIGAEGALAA